MGRPASLVRRTVDATAALPFGWSYLELVQALETGRIVACRTSVPAFKLELRKHKPVEEAPAEAAVEEARKALAWIEIQLVDMECHPVPNERYRITIPSGTAVEGRLDSKGFARVYEIDPGNCKVTFPDLDQEAWRADCQCPDLVPPPKTFVGFELVDMCCQPLADERYEVVLPDGSKVEGRLDGNGRARLEEIEPGFGELRFPDLDLEVLTTNVVCPDRVKPPPLRAAAPDEELARPRNVQDEQADALIRASALGVPFCEECEKARKARKEGKPSPGSEAPEPAMSGGGGS
jgi:hypothetical protein